MNDDTTHTSTPIGQQPKESIVPRSERGLNIRSILAAAAMAGGAHVSPAAAERRAGRGPTQRKRDRDDRRRERKLAKAGRRAARAGRQRR